MGQRKFKLKLGYGYIRDYLNLHLEKLKYNDLDGSGEEEIKHVENLLHDLEYLELCAEAVSELQSVKKGFELLQEL